MTNPLAQLCQFIVEHYDLEDLRSLCFELGVDYDDLRGEGKAAKARELVLYLGRLRRFDSLLDALRRTRPKLLEEVDFDALYAALPIVEIGDARLLEELERDYRAKLAQKYELISMQGISPKVRNQTIGIRMEDVFIPLQARGDFSLLVEMPEVFDPRLIQYRLLQLLIQARLGEQDLRALCLSVGIAYESISGATMTRQLEKLVAYALRQRLLSGIIDAVRKSRPGLSGADLLGQDKPIVAIKDMLRLLRSVVKGHPGSGKSTLTRYVVWAAATRRAELIGAEPADRLPILARAIEFGEELEQGQVDRLDAYIVKKAGRFGPLIQSALAAGRALVLIDGLDEVGQPALRVRVKERVDDFIADPVFAHNQIVLTTRIVGYERSGLTGSFPHLTLAELTDEQIEDFIGSWYGAIHAGMPEAINVETERKQLLEAIRNSAGIRRLARNPLLLTIIALIKWQGRTLPDQRVLLYDAAAQTLVRSWPLTQRRIELDELFIREWLAPIALQVFSDEISDLIDEPSLMEELVRSMCRLKSMTVFEARQDSKDLLDDISLHSGILLPRGTDADGRNLYGFLHQTFAEYLSAYYIGRLLGRWRSGFKDIRARPLLVGGVAADGRAPGDAAPGQSGTVYQRDPRFEIFAV